MTVEDNKKMVVAFYEALNVGDYDAAAAMCHEDFVFYNQIDTARPGAEGFIEAEKKHIQAFEGCHFTPTVIGEGDRVAAYVVTEGKHTGTFYGFEPTGRKLRMSMGNFFTFKDGKIIEKRAHYDRYDHLQQLGWVPN